MNAFVILLIGAMQMNMFLNLVYIMALNVFITITLSYLIWTTDNGLAIKLKRKCYSRKLSIHTLYKYIQLYIYSHIKQICIIFTFAFVFFELKKKKKNCTDQHITEFNRSKQPKKKKKPFKTIAFFPQSVARHNHKGQFTKVFDVFMEVNLSYSNRIINNVFCRLFRSLSIALSLFPLCNSYSSTEKQKKKILVVMLISQLQHFCCLAILLYLYARFP